MKRYSPGAINKEECFYVCDCCEVDDGRSTVVWGGLPKRAGHFVLCFACISNLYMEYVSPYDKKSEAVTIKRRAVSEELRAKIFKKGSFKCVNCGSSDLLQIDHIIPFAVGGDTVETNLQLLCRSCNLSKRFKGV